MTRPILIAGASLLALLTAPVLAEDSAEPTLLDGIVLTAASDATVQADGYVGAYAQSATKTDTPLAQVPQSVSVVTARQIADQGAQTLGQALGHTAGVLGQPFGADPRFDSPTLRGFEAGGSQYVNGLRQLRDLGAPAFETYGLQQVEVLKGPNSSLYGAGSPAGIINQVQKRAQDRDFGEVGLGLDSNGASQAFFDLNRAPDAVLSWRLTGIGRDSRTQIDELTNRRAYLGGALRWQPDGATTVDVIASQTTDAPITPPRVPFALTETEDGRTLRDRYFGEPAFDDSDRSMTNLGIEIDHQLDNGWTLSQGFRAERFDWTYTGHYVTGLDADGAVTRGANLQDESTRGVNLDTRLSNSVTTGAATHDLLLGLDIRQYDARTDTQFFAGQPIDARDPVFGALPGDAPFYSGSRDVTLDQIGLYAQDEITWDNWRAGLALRHDRTRITGTENGARIDQSDSATTGRAGLGYVLASGVMPYASYSTSFDPTIGTDIETGRPLRPTTGRQWELGAKYEPAGFDGLISAAVYDLTQQNLVRNLGEGQRRQIGEVRSQGIELEATAALTEGWDLRASYAHNRTEQRGGAEDGLQMPNAPRNLASLWLDRDFGQGLRAGGGIRHIGARQGDFANTVALDSVTLIDLAARYSQGPIEASINLDNLTDEVYLAHCGSFGCSYGEGRSIAARIAYSW
ncbi:TonB-dependent siderophore receptor [Paracoccus aestuarii]|nr:TonB-dependent siderophore receptor [Paracoccus aestuarii]WCR00942.1 TonB-dependent siderophore receptor [Paracoccus aestuarii]